ncbi:MAG: thioredoxin family protein [Candidatus Heimdallarchaeota archaeon]
MVRTESLMMPLGTKAPEFSLKDVRNNQIVTYSQQKGKKGTLIFFICNHCPYVIHVRDLFGFFSEEYQSKGVSFIAINANNPETHPQDGPEQMKQLANEKGWRFPFLFDETQEIAKAYTAICTPDFFLFNSKDELFYRGQMDDSRPRSGTQPTGKDLRSALDALIEDKQPPESQKPSVGCSIKWKPGNEPEYVR